jgi:SAM-dependent methyltransferase
MRRQSTTVSADGCRRCATYGDGTGGGTTVQGWSCPGVNMSLSILFRALQCMVAAAAMILSVAVRADPEPRVPYVPTPQAVVDRMLDAAQVKSGDYLIDLGSGDGRIVVTAAKRFGIRGFGVDINPERIREANANARKAGVSGRVSFSQSDLFATDLSDATVITMYLLPRVNIELRPRLLALRPGTRIVSHDFDMGDWRPNRQWQVKADDKYFGTGGSSDVYLWTVPAPVAGHWDVGMTVAGKQRRYVLMLNQKYQQIEGTISDDGSPVRLSAATINGDSWTLAFTLPVNGVPVKHVLKGRLNGDHAAGTAELSGGRLAGLVEWTARRAAAAAPAVAAPVTAGGR